VSGDISYLRTPAQIKSLLALGFKTIVSKLRGENIRVSLRALLNHHLKERKDDPKYLDKVQNQLLAWQAERDRNGLGSVALVYHPTGPRALHGFRYQAVSYEKKDRQAYQNERQTFPRIKASWLKEIAQSHREELKTAGIPEAAIERMAKYGVAPTGFQVHHRIPLDDGGTNDRKNLILIRNDVEHRAVHGYYNPGELRADLIAVGDRAMVVLPLPPANSVVYPDPSCGYVSERITNAKFAEIYDVD
jgi:hypothetical protein